MNFSRLAPFFTVLSMSLLPAVAQASDYDESSRVTFHRGDGDVTFAPTEYCSRDGGYPAETVLLDGIRPGDVRVTQVAGGTRIAVLGSADVVTAALYSERGEDCGVGIYRLIFADGTTWINTARPATNTVPYDGVLVPIVGTEGRDRLRGTTRGDRIQGLGGDDRLYGDGGDDDLQGGDGDDTLYGDDGNDTLNGGQGDDDLYGDRGDDTYVFTGNAFGYDLIDDASGAITLVLAESPSDDTRLTRSGNNLFIDVQSSGTARIKIRGYFARDARIVSLRLRDVTWNASEVEKHIVR